MARKNYNPIHTIRVPDNLWSAAKAKAILHGTTVSQVIRDALHRYIDSTNENVPRE